MNITKTGNFLFVFLPLMTIFCMGVFLDVHKTKSERERRMLTVMPENPLLSPQEFERALSDHIWGRDTLIDWYFKLGIGLDLGTKKTLIGSDGWLFQNEFHDPHNLHNLQSYANKIDLSSQQIKKLRDDLSLIQKLCDENNIKMYLTFPPDKHRVYARYMPTYILRDNRPSLAKRVAKLLPKEINFVPLEDALVQASMNEENLLYYKTESHWAEDAAYLAYRLLMDKIKQDFPEVKTALPEDFTVSKISDIFSPYIVSSTGPKYTRGNLFVTGLENTEAVYTHYELKKEHNIMVKWEKNFKYSVNPNKKYNVYIIGDSYGTYMSYFFAETFNRVYFYRFNPPGEKFGIFFNSRLQEMKEQKTDILILSVSDLKLMYLTKAF